MHTATGHPSRWNDKTLAYQDKFLRDIHKGTILQDCKFSLYYWEGAVGSSPILSQRCRGAWGLVDNGYHRWSCTQAPAKVNALLIEQRLSDWIESFRKDIECTFGILKGRFRILKTGVRLEGAVACDRIWLTCCALHNMLLEVDGLDLQWQEGVRSDWEGDMGENDPSECQRMAPFAMRRLQQPQLSQFGSREHEREAGRRGTVRMMNGDQDIDPEDDDDDDEDLVTEERRDEEGAIFLNSLAYNDFQERLVVHFDIKHRRNEIEWPTRNPSE